MSIVISVLIVILILGILSTIHELGHFWTACLLKIKAFEVSIFVGPQLVNWKRNGVDYSIRAIPIGAYVRFTDIDDDGKVVESDDPSLLINSARWKRLLIALAGPFMNLLLGVIIFFCYFFFVTFPSLAVDETLEGTQLYNASYVAGDTLVAVNGETVYTPFDVQTIYSMDNITENMVITLKSQTDGSTYDVELVPEIESSLLIGITHHLDTDNKYNGWEIIDVYPPHNGGDPILQPGDFLVAVNDVAVADEEAIEAIVSSHQDGDKVKISYYRNGEYFEEDCAVTYMETTNSRGVYFKPIESGTWKGAWDSFVYAVRMPISVLVLTKDVVADAFKGDVEAYNVVSGPVGVVNAVDEVVDNVDTDNSFKFTTLLCMAGFISVALVITNMLPLPGLDGSQLIMIIVEMVIGHRVSRKTEDVIAVVGFIVLLLLVLFAFSSDILKIVFEGW